MSIVKRNISANFIGSSIRSLSSIVFLPFVLKIMGIEAYGLVGISATLQGIFSLLDMGLTTALSRQMAILSGKPDKVQDMRDFLRTFELVYWAIGLVISLIVFFLAPFIANQWLQGGKYSPETICNVIRIIGIGIFFSWPVNLYNDALTGIQRIFMLNVINTGMGILRSGGVLIALWIISPTVEVFFFYNILIAGLQTCFAARLLWHYLPQTGKKTCVRFEILKDSRHLLAGLSGIMVTGMILGQMDKIILSRLVTLEMFGYYTLAMSMAIYIKLIASSIYVPLYPRLTQLVGLEDTESVKQFYHKSCQFVSVIVLPVTVMVALYSKDIMTLWLRNPNIVQHTHLVVSILAIWTGIGSMTTMPYCLQVAYGWTKLTFIMFLVRIIIQAPMMLLMAHFYGTVGIAISLLICEIGYLLININLMHSRLLPGEKYRWYINDVSRPLMGALCCGILGRWFYNAHTTPIVTLATLSVIFIMMFISSAWMAPEMRKWMIPQFKKYASHVR